MSAAVAVIAELVGEDYAKVMSKNNPQAVVDGKPIPTCPIPTKPEKRKKWFFF
jgi:hypothetical protein